MGAFESRYTETGVWTWPSLVLALACLTGCETYGSDTCTGGTNMEHPRLVDGLEPTSGVGYVFRITWDPGTGRGASLPDAYFAHVSVDHVARTGLASSVESVALTDRRVITVSLRDHPSQVATGGKAELTLYFSDRRVFIRCRHPGIEDSYALRVSLEFDPSGQLTGSELEEIVSLGPI
jgi:hypothetical protein